MAPKGRRIDCAGGCGRRILPYYNPSFLCRKCSRKRALKALKIAKKNRRMAEHERKELPTA